MIYRSALPNPVLPELGVFDFCFPADLTSAPYIDPVALDPNLPMFIDGLTGRMLTRGELELSAKRLATGLQNCGISRGDTTLLLGPNSIEWVIAAWGCQAAGVVCSPANSAYGPKELAHQYNDSGSTSIMIDPSLLSLLSEAMPLFKVQPKVFLLNGASHLHQNIYDIMAAPTTAETFNGIACHSTAWLCYSSGTTGLPKGVMTSHHNITSQIQAMLAVFPKLKPSADAVLGVLPFSHIFGLTAAVHFPLITGVPVVLYPRFNLESTLAGIEKYKISYASVVPPILLSMVHSPLTDKYDLTSLRTAQSGAAPLPAEVASAFMRKFPHARVSQGWGLTETSPAVTFSHPDQVTTVGPDGRERTTSIGQIIPTWEVRLVDEDGNDVPEGQRGEIWVAGPSVMKGYHNNPEATRKTMDGKYFKTGDICVRDPDGWFYIVDRVKELIKYKGFQVPPAELEALLLEHPKVMDSGVIGVFSDAEATELPRAYVVPRAGVTDDSAALSKEITAWIQARVAQHKRLRGGVIIVNEIPKSPSGKILRNALRERAKEEVKDEAKKTKASARL